MIVCDPSQKPLIFFYLAHVHQVDNALVFTKSAESTARLVKLFELFEEISPMTGTQKFKIRHYSSDLPPSERKYVLEQFREKKINVYSRFQAVFVSGILINTLQPCMLGSDIPRFGHQPCRPRRQL